MEIAFLPQNSIKLKGKQKTLVIDPQFLKSKTVADASLFLDATAESAEALVEGNSLTIQGPGEYEIGGIKITGMKSGEQVVYVLAMDGLDILVAKESALPKLKDTLGEYHIVVLQATGIADQSLVAALNANVLAFYGEKKEEIEKAFGVDNPTPIGKYVAAKDKLPEDTQVVLLV